MNQIPEQTREFVTIIANESQRLSRMIDTFLAVTKLAAKGSTGGLQDSAQT